MLCNEIRQLQREISRKIEVGKNKIETVAPSVSCHNRVGELVTQLRDRSEKVLHKARHFCLCQFTEANRIGEKNRDDARSKRFFRGSRDATASAARLLLGSTLSSRSKRTASPTQVSPCQ